MAASALTSMTSAPSVVVTGGLIGGFAAARYTKNRALGGAVFAAAGAAAVWGWHQQAGPVPAAALAGVYTLAMGGSHPLAHKLGPWPSVLLVTGLTVAASEAVLRRA
jgi:hypothetical protein